MIFSQLRIKLPVILFFTLPSFVFAAKVNQAPVVDAGADQIIVLPATASVTATATDDHLPNPPNALSYLWTLSTAPVGGAVTFTKPTEKASTVFFNLPGTYVLKFTADDSALNSSDTVKITVKRQPATFAYPRGSYTLWAINDSLIPGVGKSAQALIDNKGMTGILLSAKWTDIEIGPGVYDWTNVNSRIYEAAAAGLKVALKITASVDEAPYWIMENPAVTKISLTDLNSNHSTFCQQVEGPVFWDPIFHAGRLALISEMGRQFSANPNVQIIQVGFANYYTGDWSIPDAVGNQPGCNNVYVDQVQQWLNAGYTFDKLLNVGKEIVDLTAASFPTKALKMPISNSPAALDGGSKTAMPEAIVNYIYASKYKKRFFLQRNTLNSNVPLANSSDVIEAKPAGSNYVYKLLTFHPAGFQMLDAVANGEGNGCRMTGGVPPCEAIPTLDKIKPIAETYNPYFVEFWKADAIDPTLYPQISDLTQNIGGTLRP